MMFSLENMLQIAGDPDYASQIERIAFNALPTQISDNFMTRQYFQQINKSKFRCATEILVQTIMERPPVSDC